MAAQGTDLARKAPGRYSRNSFVLNISLAVIVRYYFVLLAALQFIRTAGSTDAEKFDGETFVLCVSPAVTSLTVYRGLEVPA